jgi:hypothetical protein
MASGSTSICRKIKYLDGKTDGTCASYTVFILSKKLVRFQFLNSEGGLTTCDVAPGGSKACVYYADEGTNPLFGDVGLDFQDSLTAVLSSISIT